jgi:hypothetical protein
VSKQLVLDGQEVMQKTEGVWKWVTGPETGTVF